MYKVQKTIQKSCNLTGQKLDPPYWALVEHLMICKFERFERLSQYQLVPIWFEADQWDFGERQILRERFAQTSEQTNKTTKQILFLQLFSAGLETKEVWTHRMPRL